MNTGVDSTHVNVYYIQRLFIVMTLNRLFVSSAFVLCAPSADSADFFVDKAKITEVLDTAQKNMCDILNVRV